MEGSLMIFPSLMLYFRVLSSMVGIFCAVILLLKAQNPLEAHVSLWAAVQIFISIAGGIFLAAVLLVDLFKILFTNKGQK